AVRSHERQRPRSMRDRMLEQRESVARGAAVLSEELSNRGDDKSDGGGERDAFEKSAGAVKTLVDACLKIAPDIGK
ncbi:MAG TPA: hypothetical protein VFB31_07235, partial [Pseudolabrys sp.]|nr:hypothetical protein [Pseudolabrys sp.]